MNDNATEVIADYVKEHCTNLKGLSRKTEISHGILRRSLIYRTRALRADEFLNLCEVLGLDPQSITPGKERS